MIKPIAKFNIFSPTLITKRNNYSLAPTFSDSNLHILASFSNARLKDGRYHSTASTVFSETPFIYRDSVLISHSLMDMNMEKLHLYIVENVPSIATRTVETGLAKSFRITSITYDEFFNSETIDAFFKLNKFDNNNVFFNFREADWSKIVLLFWQQGVAVGGGANTKRHILAPVQSRLAIFTACIFNRAPEKITESFRLGSSRVETRTRYDKTSQAKMIKQKYNPDGSLRIPDLNKLSELDSEAFVDEIEMEQAKTENRLESNTPAQHYNPVHSEPTTDYSGIDLNKIENTPEPAAAENGKSKSNIIKRSNSPMGGIDTPSNKRGYHTKCHTTAQFLATPLIGAIVDKRETILIRNKSSFALQQIRGKSTIAVKQDRTVTNTILNMKSLPQAHLISDSSPLSFLDTLESVIKNSQLDPIKAQLYIENSLMESEKNKLENEKHLLTTQAQVLHKHVLEANKTLNILFEKKELKLKFPSLDEELNKLEYLLLAFSLGVTYFGRLDWTAMSNVIGNAITYKVFADRKKRTIKVINKNKIKRGAGDTSSYNEFIEDIGFSHQDFIRLGDFFLQILSQFPHNIFEREFSKAFYFSREQAKVNINPRYIEKLRQNIIIDPASLPMVCPPVEWSDSQFGGYLENKNKQTSIITGSLLGQQHKTENLDSLYKAVNSLQAIKFEINSLLLDFINNEGTYLLEKLDTRSEELQREITLKTAQVYSKTPFYLPVNSDWRTRLYTQSFFISYQGGDLASALLNFWEGEPLTEEGKYYLYINGANNHNGSNISKKSFIERINWVKDNYKKIVNLDKELILAADNKFVFTAFCLNMRELDKNKKAIIKTPVFLDATCSGIQHLAAMMKDMELGPKVNLSNSEDKDTPSDIYSELIDPINEALNRFGREDVKYAVLALVKFNRKIIKPIVMTKIYNISIYGISEQLRSSFEKILSNTKGKDKDSTSSTLDIKPSKQYSLLDSWDNDDTIHLNSPTERLVEKIQSELTDGRRLNKEEYYAPGIEGKVILTRTDIFKIAEIINDQIFVIFPSLNYIYSYFLEISKLMIKLNIPLSWFTPSGIKITQDYLKSKTTKLSIKLFGVKKTLVLRETLKETNNTKQINAIIPNIIHSLDANHLMNVINTIADKGIGPVITVHDCFGTLPNKMGSLQYEVKKEFVLLYTQQNFLETFHNRIIQSMRDNNIEIIEEIGVPKFVLLMDEALEIPQLPKSGDLDLINVINSRYMIS